MYFYDLKRNPWARRREHLPAQVAPPGRRVVGTLGSALLGALCGVLLGAFATSVSGSVLGVAGVVLIGIGIGGAAGDFSGALVGALCGGLAAFVLREAGGSPLTRGLTVAACALLAGWLRWRHHRPRSAG